MDQETERMIGQHEEDIRQLRSDVGDIQVILMGPPPMRSNGIRSEVKTLAERVQEAIDWAHEVWNVKRREECLGIEECGKLREYIDTKMAEANEMAIAQMQTEVQKQGNQLSSRAVIAAAVISALIPTLAVLAVAFLKG